MERIYPKRDSDESEGLVGMLDLQRATILHKCEGLDHEQLNRVHPPSTLTLAALLKHLAAVEDSWITERFCGKQMPEPWASAPYDDDEDWEFHSAVNDSPEYLRQLYAAACARSNTAIANLPPDALAPAPDYYGNLWNLRWVLLHLIEETARHAGHADLLRESIDGVVGD
jgi:uncharacterized damage-inducible protein DinB